MKPIESEDTENTVELVSETLGGDLTGWLTDRIKNLPKTWAEMSEGEQTDIIVSARDAVRSMVSRAVRIIAADGRPVIMAVLDKVVVKDGIRGVLSMSKTDPLRHALVDAQGDPVLLVVADTDRYMGGEMPTADKDEPELPIEDDGWSLFDHSAAGREAA